MGRARTAAAVSAAEYFVHSQRGPAFGDATPLRDALDASAAAVTSVPVLFFFSRALLV